MLYSNDIPHVISLTIEAAPCDPCTRARDQWAKSR